MTGIARNIVRLFGSYFSLYYLLFAAAFISIYHLPVVTPALNLLLLGTSYYYIVRDRRLDLVAALALYSKSMNGFVVYHNGLVYDLVNALTNVMPLVLYLATSVNSWRRAGERPRYYDLLRRHKYAILLALVLTFSLLFNFFSASDMVTRRYLPLLFFILVVFAMRNKRDFDAVGMIYFFRALFVASLGVYFFSNYLGLTKRLLESDLVFSVSSPSNTYSLIYFGFLRNYGFTWDHRLLGIAAYLFLLLSLVFKPKHFKADVLLSGLVVITTTSRGAMLTYALILCAYLLIVYRRRFLTFGLVAGVAGLVFLFAMDRVLPNHLTGFIRSFSPTSQYNAISQRQVFADYALGEFIKKPVLGHGIGYLSSAKIHRYLVVNEKRIRYVSDAFWYVLLAELGIVGFFLYWLFLTEVFHSSSILNLALFCGFALQLIGTDIPDMRFNYFAILIVVYTINNTLAERAKELFLGHENQAVR